MVSPQSRRERKEENFSIAGERPAIEKLRCPTGNKQGEGRDWFSFSVLSTENEKKVSLCVLWVFAVKHDSEFDVPFSIFSFSN